MRAAVRRLRPTEIEVKLVRFYFAHRGGTGVTLTVVSAANSDFGAARAFALRRLPCRQGCLQYRKTGRT